MAVPWRFVARHRNPLAQLDTTGPWRFPATAHRCTTSHGFAAATLCFAIAAPDKTKPPHSFAVLRPTLQSRRPATSGQCDAPSRVAHPPHCGSVATPSRAMPQHFLHAASHRFAMALPRTALHYPAPALLCDALPPPCLEPLGNSVAPHCRSGPCRRSAALGCTGRRITIALTLHWRAFPSHMPLSWCVGCRPSGACETDTTDNRCYSFPERNFPFSSNAT